MHHKLLVCSNTELTGREVDGNKEESLCLENLEKFQQLLVSNELFIFSYIQ